jgi:hypothetical protein
MAAGDDLGGSVAVHVPNGHRLDGGVARPVPGLDAMGGELGWIEGDVIGGVVVFPVVTVVVEEDCAS